MPTDVPIDQIPISEFRGRSYGTPSITWRLDTAGIDWTKLTYGMRKAVKRYLEQDAAPDVRRYMQSHHGWQNRTRTAEVGLTCDVVTDGSLKGDRYMATLRMYHTARHNGYEYGRALEGIDPIHGVYRKDLGVLDDTVRLYTPLVVEGMRGILDKYS